MKRCNAFSLIEVLIALSLLVSLFLSVNLLLAKQAVMVKALYYEVLAINQLKDRSLLDAKKVLPKAVLITKPGALCIAWYYVKRRVACYHIKVD